ncbi:MAG: radical SAM protein [Candidatus Omnitrophica bacterium]|nr:radical SAM protein [Candidatus Omnitrophota bacterium]
MNISFSDISRYKKYLKIARKVILRKPKVIFRILKNYAGIILFKKKVLRKVEMGLTFDCQCNCVKCSSDFMKRPEAEKLSLDEIRRVARDIIGLGAIQVNLTGGEPLMAENIFEIIECFQPDKVIITINTNGILLTEPMIDKLEKAGVDIIKISIDSPIEEEHDISRGVKGCFARAKKALGYISKKSGLLGQISTVCIKENLNSDRIWKLVAMAKSYNALLGLTIPAASGRWVSEEKVLLGEKEKAVLNELIKVPHVIRDTDEAYLRSHCPAGSEELYFTCLGDVIPCPLIQISFGNVRKESIKAIWAKMSDFSGFKDKLKPGCLAGENKRFIEDYLLPLKDYKRLPVPIEDHPRGMQREQVKDGLY